MKYVLSVVILFSALIGQAQEIEDSSTESNRYQCNLTLQSLKDLNGYTDPGSLGIWFQSIPINFNLILFSEKMVVNFNGKDVAGIKGESFENAWAHDYNLEFRNKQTSTLQSSFIIRGDKLYGSYESNWTSPLTVSGTPVKHVYLMKFDPDTLTGTLKTRNPTVFSKFRKYNLEFSCQQ